MKERLSLLALLASLCLAVVFQAADNVAGGNLTAVSAGSISVRLRNGSVMDLRLPKSGDLAGKAIASKYKLGENVEITFKLIDRYLDKSTDNYLVAELKKIRSVGRASPEDLAKVLAALSWKSGTNLLRVPPLPARAGVPSDSFELERIRKTNLGIAAELPKFAATETASRFVRLKGESTWKLQDTVVSELVYQSVHATRQNVRINGKPLARNSSSYWLPGFNWWIGWEIGFGSELLPLFDRKCANRFEYEGPTDLRGMQLVAYPFQAPADGCFGPDSDGLGFYNPARTGRVLVERDGDRIVQFEMEQHEVGAGGVGDWKQVLIWDDVKVADTIHRLPVSGDYVFSSPNGNASRAEVKYTNHRVFSSTITLSFPKETVGQRE